MYTGVGSMKITTQRIVGKLPSLAFESVKKEDFTYPEKWRFFIWSYNLICLQKQ